MKSRLSVLLLFLIALPLLAQPEWRQRGRSSQSLTTLPLESLSSVEENSLYQMREEEKLAHDVYQALYEKWNLSVFQNIAASEQRHSERVLMLLGRYNLEDPAFEEPGLFSDEHLQELYTTLVAKGSVSELDALMVGATIEDLDIYDLTTLMEQIDNQDILQVYENLTKGSRNHMRSFVGLIESAGSSYSAQYISQELLDEIVSTSMESGPAGNSRGRGNRGGRQGSASCPSEVSPIRVGNYPNPANPTTTIVFQLTEPGSVELTIFNTRGQAVRSALLGSVSSGEQHFNWDARDDAGHPVTSGIYYCRISSGGVVATHRMLLMR
jgi:hypothetical protein